MITRQEVSTAVSDAVGRVLYRIVRPYTKEDLRAAVIKKVMAVLDELMPAGMEKTLYTRLDGWHDVRDGRLIRHWGGLEVTVPLEWDDPVKLRFNV